MSRAPTPESFLPLRPVEAQILVSLTRGRRHGYAILQELERREEEEGEAGAVPGLATLYRALRRLEKEGLLEEAPGDEEDPEDDRRRIYRLSDLGRKVAAAEVRRLAGLVELARSGLGPRPEEA